MVRLPFVNREAGRPLFGLSVAYPGAGALERLGPDWDWIWIDAQHGDLDEADAVELIRSSHRIDRPALVRIPDHNPAWIDRMLGAGAAGLIVPMVENVREAAALLASAKFPPAGNRSYGGRAVGDHLGRGFYRTANRDTVLILQVESEAAVSRSDELAALEGVDGLFLGPDDLAIRRGLDVDTPKSAATIGGASRAFAASCRRHGKLAVGLGASEAMLAVALEEKFDLVAGGGQVGFIAGASRDAARRLRAVESEQSSDRPLTEAKPRR